MAAEEHASFLADPHSWVLFSAILFAIVGWKKGKQPLLKILDGRTARIKADLEEAARLKNEAQELLADYQKKHRDAVQTAQKIIDNAQEAALLIQKDAGQKLEENITRREGLLLERIARAEAAAVQSLRHQAADIAAAAAEKLLAATMDKRGAKLVDEAIEDLPKRLN
ncbi:MAG: F0F1 ATP synthase subunit B [Alphaproteobacteria bacterium]|nr:F0F1 ATP synthase subunit B [Alphaproteobacteria bacterium]